MFLKAAFKNSPVYIQLLMLLVIIASCMIVAVFFSSVLIISKVGISPEAIVEVQQNLFDNPEIIRGTLLLQTLGIFLFPAIICAWLFSDDYKEYLGVDQPIYKPVAIWAILSIIVAVPFINLSHHLNQQMVLPEAFSWLEKWMKEMEDTNSRTFEAILNTKSIPTIIFNILISCVIAAISEEFMFRGLLQKFFSRIIPNPHVLIWTIAILFSAMHFQFYGFIPRMILGACLGYLMYYTKTIWIPVLAHFTNNFLSLATYYLFQDKPDEMQNIDTIGTGATWWLSVASLALLFFCFTQIKKAGNQ